MIEDKIAEFVRKRRKETIKPIQIKESKTPWYRKPIERAAFSIKEGKDGKFYAHHNEWSKRIWIGPYKTKDDANQVINDYVMESLKGNLYGKKESSIHSTIIENDKLFFKI